MSANLRAIPKLSDLVECPDRAADVPLEAVPAMRGKLAELDTLLQMRIATANSGPAERAEGDRLLAVEEAAGRLGMAPATLYRRAKTKPYSDLVVETGLRKLMFSQEKIGTFIRRRTGR